MARLRRQSRFQRFVRELSRPWRDLRHEVREIRCDLRSLTWATIYAAELANGTYRQPEERAAAAQSATTRMDYLRDKDFAP